MYFIENLVFNLEKQPFSKKIPQHGAYTGCELIQIIYAYHNDILYPV